MSHNEHITYHHKLLKSSKFYYLLAVADEIASEWIYGEDSLADKLDEIWNEHKDLHLSVGHASEAPR